MITTWLQSVMTGAVSQVPVRFCVGDRVEVLRACRLPKVEDVMDEGVIVQITEDEREPIYWIDGFSSGRPAEALRLIQRGR